VNGLVVAVHPSRAGFAGHLRMTVIAQCCSYEFARIGARNGAMNALDARHPAQIRTLARMILRRHWHSTHVNESLSIVDHVYC
jgi:hypothetical protein